MRGIRRLLRVEVAVGRHVDEEARCRGRQVESVAFHSDHFQVEQITSQCAVAGHGIPARVLDALDTFKVVLLFGGWEEIIQG